MVYSIIKYKSRLWYPKMLPREPDNCTFSIAYVSDFNERRKKSLYLMPTSDGWLI